MIEEQINILSPKLKKLLRFSVDSEGYTTEYALYYLVKTDNEIDIYQWNDDTSAFLSTVYINGIGSISNVGRVIINALAELLLPLQDIKISYIKSSYYTEEEFRYMLEKAQESFQFGYDIEVQKNNQLVRACESLNLNPDHENKIDEWYARCPSKLAHFIELDLDKNSWRCEKCHKSGSVTELKKWNNEIIK